MLWANLGDALLALGRRQEARRAFEESLAQLDIELGRTHPIAATLIAASASVAGSGTSGPALS